MTEIDNLCKNEEDIITQKSTDTNLPIPKTISVLLDLYGTSNFIDDEKAKIFISQLDKVRKKFEADICTISISTNFRDSILMIRVLDILSQNMTDSFKIGLNFYHGGIYDYDRKLEIPQDYNFNMNKMSTFDDYYIHNNKFDNQWFAVFDDGISEDTYKKYQNNHPMLLCRPSQYECDLKYNCFMSIATTTEDFDGVLEGLATYVNSIEGLSPAQILETQKNMITHLPCWELSAKIRKKEYAFLEKYFKEGYADDDDYRDALYWLVSTNSEEVSLNKEQCIQLKNILDLLLKRFQNDNDELGIEKVKLLTNSWKLSNM